MGSEEIKEMGLQRAGDRIEGSPWQFTILDVDIPRNDLLALYDGKPAEQDIIRSVKQTRRAATLAPPEFVDICRIGITEPVQFYRLKEDCNGKRWLLIGRGANRCAALRIVNAERTDRGLALYDLPGIQAKRLDVSQKRPESAGEAALFALEMNAASNVRAAMLPSHKAETAAAFKARGIGVAGIVRYIDGARTVEDIWTLLALDLLCDSVKDAVDAGKVTAEKAAGTLVKGIEDGEPDVKSEERQRAWLAKRLAPRPERAPAAARTAVKRPSAKRLDAFADAVLVHTGAKSAVYQAIALARGTMKLADVTDEEVRFAWAKSEGVGK